MYTERSHPSSSWKLVVCAPEYEVQKNGSIFRSSYCSNTTRDVKFDAFLAGTTSLLLSLLPAVLWVSKDARSDIKAHEGSTFCQTIEVLPVIAKWQ